MTKVLIVEDSRSFAALVAKRVRLDLGFEPHVAYDLAEAEALLAADADYLAALIDITLPDARRGEAVDLAISHQVPAVVLTSDISDTMRESFWNRRIADYILKGDEGNVDYVVQLLARLHQNPQTKILVVDDSRSYRHAVTRLLAAHRYHVLEAATGEEALAVLEEHPDTRLVMADYSMPGMDGFVLTREIRRRFGKDMMAVIGVSAVGGARLSARFIKSGANDYLNKPFLVEEFYTRITQNLEMLEHIAQVRDMAEKDFLTRVYNRRYFFSAGSQLHALLSRRSQPMTVAMLDIDHFKNINDSLGHEAGDAVLRQMAQVLSSRFRVSDIVARLGGEEFCVLASDIDADQALLLFEELRATFEATPVLFGDIRVSYTVSMGLCSQSGLSLDEMLREADRMLYRSKSAGRNRVSLSRPGA
ncbi:MAG TPA: diguanylate cyclase [Humidesulfovibrio sp.]|uniref:diguanylate cyclase n=1 Tax=Humidesulfovibrio sp. TaxID=2910988 RepID=UPI002BC05657|nr:diguanylate cyclase [Humidesulfovibrio sp.]HWR03192.1 diguanylate cyclase [Humidesulfovibrio sp.]